MLVGTVAQLRNIDKTQYVKVTDVALPTAIQFKSLGVIVVSQLTFMVHVNAVPKACNYHIWSFRHVRHLTHTLLRQVL